MALPVTVHASLCHDFFQETDLLIADSSLPKLELLLEGLSSDCALALIEPSHSPLALAMAVARSVRLERLHVMGHGQPGAVQLGRTRLRQRHLRCLPSLSAGSRLQAIYLWSCSTGATPLGREFLQTLADLSGASVFGADGPIGHASRGGNWALSVRADPRQGRVSPRSSSKGPRRMKRRSASMPAAPPLPITETSSA